MNQITVAGHLGGDPEVRFTSSGKKVTTIRVAARARKGGKGETIWWRVTVWGEEFDGIISHLKKGSAVIVIGELSKPEIFTDREGRPQVSMNITAQNIMFSPFGRPEGSGSAEGMTSSGQSSSSEGIPQEASFHGQGKSDPVFSEDEIPF
jgi:single-strand DNA-binding protein